MTKRYLRRTALAAATVAACFVAPGCGSEGAAKMPDNPPPIPTDAQGKPQPPPTAASPAKAK